ncbi:MAG: hypothetical protein AAB893_00980, partial [Patescibacteria group bacterium]
MNTTIPFYPNADNTHCFQACIKMLAKHFWPQEDYSWDELDNHTAKVKDLWTWPMAGVLWLQQKGLEVVDIEIFNYQQFVEKKEQYLSIFFGKKVSEEQIKNSNLEQEVKYAQKFQEKIEIENRIPEKKDIIQLLKLGYLLICNINSEVLDKKGGYTGHFVVITGNDEVGYFLHDPGLPAYKNRKVTFELFEQAWAYPNEKAKNILAF